jgi:hypothetical protein
LFNQLTLKYKTFVQFYLHGSLNKQENTTTTTTKKLQSLINVFNKLNLTLDKEPRSSYDYGLTFIAKQMNHNQAEKQLGLVLTLPQTNKKIYGQVNIFRYLQRLLLQNEKQSKQEQLLDTLVLNDCLDKCTNQLSENKNNYLNNLNKTFSSSKYLLGDKLTLADYYVWSQLKQFNLLTSSSSSSQASLNEWSKRVESSDQFIQLLL